MSATVTLYFVICQSCQWGLVRYGVLVRPRRCERCGDEAGQWAAYSVVAIPVDAARPAVYSAQQRLPEEGGQGPGARSQAPEPGSQTSHPPSSHFCRQHNVPFQRFEKGAQVWYSHNIQGTDKWCRER